MRVAARVREDIIDRIEKKPVRHGELRLLDMEGIAALGSSGATSWRTGPLTPNWLTPSAKHAVR